MALVQTAQVSNYDFGAPSTSGLVLKFRALRGGKLILHVEAPADAPVTFSAKVSADDITYNALTAANNLVVVTDEVIQAGCYKDYTILLRQGVDAFLQFLASGEARGILQIRGGDAVLEYQKI